VPPEPVSPVTGLADAVHARLLSAPVPAGAVPLRASIEALVDESAPLLTAAARAAVVEGVAARTLGLGPLEPLLADPTVTEVMVNGPGPVWVERAGVVTRAGIDLDRPTVDLLVERAVAPAGLRADRTAPLVDARLPDGSRVNVVVPPLAVDGPYLTIRRFAARRIRLDAICTPGVSRLLAWAVAARMNVLVAGGTGAGKTTLLNALAGCIGEAERVVTVEDTAELRLAHPHVVRLEARPANAEGAGRASPRDLVRNALRMRPDRIVVGEVRGAEALDMLQAMNTGHEGSLSTCHANSPADALRRLEVMVLTGDVDLPLPAVREQVAAALDLVVQVARRPDGSRGVVEVAEVEPDPSPSSPLRTRPLTGAGGAVAPPARPPRAPGSPPPPC
jgi:pilus assembly protein CpaF